MAGALVALTAVAGPATSARADDESFGTVTGSVSFAAAPSWYSADTDFTVTLIGPTGYPVPTDIVPISYSYDGSGGFAITYPNSSAYYNDYFEPGSYDYTVVINPVDPAYPRMYLGGATSVGSAQWVSLPLAPTDNLDVGNTVLPLVGGSISGTVGLPDGLPSGGLTAWAVGQYNRESVAVAADGVFHLMGLPADTYQVAFAPAGDGPGLGAGVWWNSKAGQAKASKIVLSDGEEYAGVDQDLPKGGVITGRLLDSQGRTVPGAGVAIYDASQSADNAGSLVRQEAVSADGSYEFWGLPVGKYKVGFDTGGGYCGGATADSARSLDPKTGALGPMLPAVDFGCPVNPATAADGSLNSSNYPYASSWYRSPAATFGAARSVTISSSGQIVSNIDGVLPFDPVLAAWQPKERISGGQGGNPSEKPVSCSCADPVDTQSGEFSESADDLDIPGAGVPVQLDRVYSSALADTDGPFGYGSASTIQTHLVQDSNDPYGNVVVVQENGSTVTFATLSPQQSYLAPARVNASLAYDRSASEWVFTRNADDVFRFDDSGALVSHQDLHGNTVAYTNDSSGHVATISGSGGRSITLTWNGNHVVSAHDSAGRTVSYGYNTAGDLTSFTDANGAVNRPGFGSVF